MFFLQMAGFPGSGKSTLASEISRATGAVIIDHDVVKTALLESLHSVDLVIDSKVAGKISYDIDWSLIDFHLSNNHKVILDSPCLYSGLLERGLSLAKKHSVKYKYVECYLNDIETINYRLKNRERMLSQIQQASSVEGFNKAVNCSKRPSDSNYLVVDSSKPLEIYISDVIQYINE